MSYICENISSNAAGHLCFAGQDVTELAARYGTPLYIIDEDRVRQNCRRYTETFRECLPEGSGVLYAAKACCFRKLIETVAAEGLGADVVSPGEILTIERAGMDMSKTYYHSNDKTDADIRFAMERRVGYFVLESADEAVAVNAIAQEFGSCQKVLIRVTPGIDTHTYAAVNTGLVDSKFGVPVETGQAEALTKLTLELPWLQLEGFHCHVGSEVFAENVFERAAVIMVDFLADMEKKHGFVTKQLNLGGGYGVRYTNSDPYPDIPDKIRSVSSTIRERCAMHGISEPAVFMEPGRSIIADAGMTIYTAGSVKSIPGYKNYVSVDGGMTDNPRFALYGARYSCVNASRANDKPVKFFDLVGRCCESGDIIQPSVLFPEGTGRGDIIAVCTTGAYNFSMASNYNRIARPALVMLRGGESFEAVRRETVEDLLQLDL